MKIKNLSIIFCLFSTQLFSQSNKFEKGDFGMRYGVYFAVPVQQQVVFSGMLTEHIELGAVLTFSYGQSSSSNSDSISVRGDSALLTAGRTTRFTHKTFQSYISPFFAYHFRVKSNIDVYTGISAGFGLSKQYYPHQNEELSAPDFQETIDYKTKVPFSYSLSTNVFVGCQYFFYKKLALGVQASLGGTYSFANGNPSATKTVTNSGSNNPGTNNNYYPIQNSNTTSQLTFGTIGSVGVNLTFFFNQKEKRKENSN